jgi:hypothetical protein
MSTMPNSERLIGLSVNHDITGTNPCGPCEVWLTSLPDSQHMCNANTADSALYIPRLYWTPDDTDRDELGANDNSSRASFNTKKEVAVCTPPLMATMLNSECLDGHVAHHNFTGMDYCEVCFSSFHDMQHFWNADAADSALHSPHYHYTLDDTDSDGLEANDSPSPASYRSVNACCRACEAEALTSFIGLPCQVSGLKPSLPVSVEESADGSDTCGCDCLHCTAYGLLEWVGRRCERTRMYPTSSPGERKQSSWTCRKTARVHWWRLKRRIAETIRYLRQRKV